MRYDKIKLLIILPVFLIILPLILFFRGVRIICEIMEEGFEEIKFKLDEWADSGYSL